jgi:Fic family protein
MQLKFNPSYTITPKILNALLRIEKAREKVLILSFNPYVLGSLREAARLYTIHYSTMIEGNRLDPSQIEEVLKHEGHFPGRERDEGEVKGYYCALTYVEKLALRDTKLTEQSIQKLHALVMAHGKTSVKPSLYRDGQNVIRDARTRAIVYMPPEAKDVPHLMSAMVAWINENQELPSPLIAAIAHYQFATIHPYYDGNGRTARLLTTLILHAGGYDLKGLYSLEEYYAQNLSAYYEALTIGDSHNYYMGRAESDITRWIEYFIEGMAVSFERVVKRMEESQNQGLPDHSNVMRHLDPRQRKVLELFQTNENITSKQIGELFGFKPRTSAAMCAAWVKTGFLIINNASNKNRSYLLASTYQILIK